MNEDMDLLRPLKVADLPPSNVDLRQAVRAGRRRERFRNVALGGATVVAVLATVVVIDRVAGVSHSTPGSDASAAPSGSVRPSTGVTFPPAPTSPELGTCTFTDLVLPGIGGTSTATDPSGQIIVGTEKNEGSSAFIRIKNGKQERITGAPGGAAFVTAVNRSGDFLGGANGQIVYVYSGNTFATVPWPAGAMISASDLNDRGDVLIVVFRNGAAGPEKRAAVWPANRPAELKQLSTPEGWSSYATGISNDGTVAGFLERNINPETVPVNPETVPVLWAPDGTRRQLPLPDGVSNPIMTDLNGDWVLARNVRWNLKTGSAEVITGLWGEKIDKFGRVYGEQPNIAPPHPAVWINGTITMLPVDPQRPLGMMGDVSEDGTRITSVLQANNPPNPRPVVWTCR